jgi:hypothetical protein
VAENILSQYVEEQGSDFASFNILESRISATKLPEFLEELGVFGFDHEPYWQHESAGRDTNRRERDCVGVLDLPPR